MWIPMKIPHLIDNNVLAGQCFTQRNKTRIWLILKNIEYFLRELSCQLKYSLSVPGCHLTQRPSRPQERRGSADKQIQIWRQDIRAQVQTNTLNDVLKNRNKKWWRQGDNPWWLIGWKKWKWLMLMARWSSPLSDPCPGHCLCFCIHLRLFFRVRAWQKFYKAFGDSEKNFSLDAYIVEGFEVWPIIKEGGGLGKTGTERM